MKYDLSKYVTTDLACESGRITPDEYTGARYERRESGGATVEILTVENGTGEEETGKPVGRYVTVSDPSLKDAGESCDGVTEAVAKELSVMLEEVAGKPDGRAVRVLVAGLGNRFITPDALGPRCADGITATRHIIDRLTDGKGPVCAEVSAIDPGVLSGTGIESWGIIKGTADRIKPDAIIAVDAMAARSVSRLAATVQISDAGLSPGGGIGNHRPKIDRESMGYPVISIGSPTVVSSSTLIADALERAGTEEISPELERILENGRSFFVSLNDSDVVVEKLARVISRAINSALGTDALGNN